MDHQKEQCYVQVQLVLDIPSIESPKRVGEHNYEETQIPKFGDNVHQIMIDINTITIDDLKIILSEQKNINTEGYKITFKIKDTVIPNSPENNKYTLANIVKQLGIYNEVLEDQVLPIYCQIKQKSINIQKSLSAIEDEGDDLQFERLTADNRTRRLVVKNKYPPSQDQATLMHEVIQSENEDPLESQNKSHQPTNHKFPIRMNCQSKILEIIQKQPRDGIKCIIKCKNTNKIEYQFVLKCSDLILYDSKNFMLKFIIENQQLKIKFNSKNDFMFLLKSLKSDESLNMQYCEFDILQEFTLSPCKRKEIKKNIIVSKAKEDECKSPDIRTEKFNVHTQQVSKMGWQVKTFHKSLIIDSKGRIIIIGQTDDTRIDFQIKNLQQILVSNQDSQNFPMITFTFFEEPSYTLYFERENDCDKFLKLAEEIQIKTEGEERKDMFIIKQSYSNKRKNREMRRFTWFVPKQKNDQNQHYNGMLQLPKTMAVNNSIDEEPFIKSMLDKENQQVQQKEEDVEYNGETQIIFKVILEQEDGIERKKYLEVDYQDKKLTILKASTKKPEQQIQLMKIAMLQRSLLDHRQILIKLFDYETSVVLTFSSIYKLFQFLELYNFMQYSYQLMANPILLKKNSLTEEIQFTHNQQIATDTQPKNLRILVITFNMNRKQQNLYLDQIIPNPEKYDMIIIGGQEAKMLQKTGLMIQLANYLGGYQLMTIHTVQMWEMFLIGFIKYKHSGYVKNVHVGYKATGIANIFGNKGGLQLSFSLYDHLFNFINCHLCHGNKRFDQRNIMMSDLIKNLKIQREEIDPDIMADFQFILGDLNYRMETTYEQLIVQMDNILAIRKNMDQLHKAMTSCKKYTGYQEGEISFLPTYKRSKNDNGFFNKKNQSPSYTDRIIFKNNTTVPFHIQNYTSLEEVYGSDHRPVILDFELCLKPVRYVNLQNLLNPQKALQQGVGVITLPFLKLKKVDMQEIELYLKKKISFPSHLQISFYGDFLESFNSSSEVSCNNIARFYNDIEWKGKDLPRCFTPINDVEFIRDRRLVILIWITNEVCSQEVIGQVNLRLEVLQKEETDLQNKNVYLGKFWEQPVVIANNTVGYLDGEIKFEIVDSTKFNEQSETEQFKRPKQIIKFAREHSV